MDIPMNEWPIRARMRHVAQWLEANLAEPVTIAQAAALAVMSERNFLRRFREEFGVAPREYLMTARLTRAREMLHSTGLPADSIARRCGLRDGGHFSRLFKLRYGATPIQCRKEGGA
jgi:AraC family transcriptional regulator